MRTGRKILAAILSAIMACSALTISAAGNVSAVEAQSETENESYVCGDFEYIILDDGTAEITDYTGSDEEMEIPFELDGNTVTSIGEYVFYECESLTSVAIPDSVTSIGYCAFSACKNLTSVEIPNSVTSIGYGAFSACASLTSVTIPDSVTEINDVAFWNCTSLKSVTLPKYITKVGDLFRCCTSLTTIKIPYGVTSIGDNTFIGCKSLKSITIPDSVTSIGDNTFNNCPSLTSIKIPDSVTSIGAFAFQDCTSLTSITIPEGVKSIGAYTFKNCTRLTNVKIPNSLTSIENWAFCNCENLTGIIIPESVGYIGDRTFSLCDSLTIYGYADSYAEEYAKAKKIPFKALNIYTDILTNIRVISDVEADLGVEVITDDDCISNINAILENATVDSIYNITLTKDGAEIQPLNSATVKIPTASENAKVYRAEEDGTLTNMNAVCQGGYMVFTTEHFSLYVLAIENEVETIMGDVDGDGRLSINDGTYLQRAIAEYYTLTPEQEVLADMDGDGRISVNDVTAIQRKIAEY